MLGVHGVVGVARAAAGIVARQGAARPLHGRHLELGVQGRQVARCLWRLEGAWLRSAGPAAVQQGACRPQSRHAPYPHSAQRVARWPQPAVRTSGPLVRTPTTAWAAACRGPPIAPPPSPPPNAQQAFARRCCCPGVWRERCGGAGVRETGCVRIERLYCFSKAHNELQTWKNGMGDPRKNQLAALTQEMPC